jgi:diguanylate cyclase (GGDEF)-like protein
MDPSLNRRVLIIDDNPSIHEDFNKVLGSKLGRDDGLAADELLLFGEPGPTPTRHYYDVDSASQGQIGLEKVREALRGERPYAMAFVDMRMPPGWDGLETIERLWEVDPHLQVVICSAHGDYDWTQLIIRLGQPDKLLVVKKPFEPIEVLQCANALTRKWQNEWEMRGQMITLEDMVNARTEGLKAANTKLRQLATHDVLTGLPNRVLFEDRMDQAMTQADLSGTEFALLLFNLDNFKLVNDSMGHHAGDELLKEVGQRLRSVVRAADTLARLGGDEFVMIALAVKSRDEGLEIAEHALAMLKPPIRIQGVDRECSSSIGIAFYPGDAGSASALLSYADAAMSCAKQSEVKAHCFVPGMKPAAHPRAQMEGELRDALRRGELELHYQPKIDVVTGAIHSAEALIRWRHPERGLVSPAEFIPLAEESGLIGPIGEWVVREACRQTRKWQDEGLASIRVAVNLSPSQFRHGNLLVTMRQALHDAGLDPRFLEVELTESTVMSDAEGSVAILEQLSQMGVLVSVDDFGTGYSSMSYLRRFPVDILKIDRTFINEIVSRPDDASIVSAIVSLAHSLRLKVVAEGVETREQLDFLKTLGCDQYQGYYFSPAVPPQQFAKFLQRAPTNSSFMDDAARTHSKLAAYRRR